MHSVIRLIKINTRLLLLAIFGTLLILLRYMWRTPQRLESVLPGEAYIYKWTHGQIYYKVAGQLTAPPVVLLHAPEIAASAYEMRYLMQSLSRQYRVYALDLLGFGLSDHPRIHYSAETYVTLYQDFLKIVIGQPATLLASGLSCNYALAVATRASDLCQRLILLSPAALLAARRWPGWLARFIQRPLPGLLLYACLTPRIILRRVLEWQHKPTRLRITEEEIQQAFAAAHQSGAEHAALAFLSGELSLDVVDSLETLRQPMLIICGTRSLHAQALPANLVALGPQMHVTFIPDAGLRIQEEQPAKVLAAVEDWLQDKMPASVDDPPEPQTAVPEEQNNEPAVAPTLSSEEPHAKPGVITEPTAQEEQPAEAGPARPQEVKAYCVKCRQQQAVVNPQRVTLKNGRAALQGTCTICGTRLFRFVAS
ncbi:alpha/beta fold hydrolase [Ktedonosporobacter rubrisoli]|nr:alpha/beta fold hydrolase [Ktedonosporobacter rubrisoli]